VSRSSGLVYDAGALVAADRNRREMWSLHKTALLSGVPIVIPTVVYAQVWRGSSRGVNIARLAKGCAFRDLDIGLARRAGELCGRAGTNDIVDAAVVTLAIELGYGVVTSDPDDMRKLADSTGRRLDIVRI
jgi:hypothetical protein